MLPRGEVGKPPEQLGVAALAAQRELQERAECIVLATEDCIGREIVEVLDERILGAGALAGLQYGGRGRGGRRHRCDDAGEVLAEALARVGKTRQRFRMLGLQRERPFELGFGLVQIVAASRKM